MTTDLPRVYAAALSLDGVVYSLEPPNRHVDVIRHMMNMGVKPLDAEQGFVLNDGRFVMRKAALRIAEQAGQILPKATIRPWHGLSTDDVW